jgi:hypothetical protein
MKINNKLVNLCLNAKSNNSLFELTLFDAISFQESLYSFIAPSHPHIGATKLLCPHHQGAGCIWLSNSTNDERVETSIKRSTCIICDPIVRIGSKQAESSLLLYVSPACNESCRERSALRYAAVPLKSIFSSLEFSQICRMLEGCTFFCLKGCCQPNLRVCAKHIAAQLSFGPRVVQVTARFSATSP